MKKALSILLAFLTVISLASCAEPKSGENQSADNSKNKAVTVSESVLLDEQGVKITATGLDSGILGTELKLLIENNSGKDLTFQCRDASVNGYMIDTMMSVDVADGKKANDAVTFSSDDFETCKITTIADIELSFHIFDADWDTYFDAQPIQIKTSAADGYNYTFDDTGNVVYDENDIKLVVKGLDKDGSIFGHNIVLYIENNSDKNVTVQTRDVSVNGFMADAAMSSSVAAGKRMIDEITIMSSSLEENEISEIKDIELSFHIFDADSWDTILNTDKITITF